MDKNSAIQTIAAYLYRWMACDSINIKFIFIICYKACMYLGCTVVTLDRMRYL